LISIASREAARRNFQNWQRNIRPNLPRCSAKAKSTGDQCGLPAMANGKCWCHGGKTPSGKNWHVTQWPKGKAPDAESKLNRKLKAQQRATKKRAARIAAMSAEERQQHEEWQRSHRPGPKARRRERQQNLALAREIAETLSHPPEASTEVVELKRQIEVLREFIRKHEQPVDIFG